MPFDQITIVLVTLVQTLYSYLYSNGLIFHDNVSNCWLNWYLFKKIVNDFCSNDTCGNKSCSNICYISIWFADNCSINVCLNDVLTTLVQNNICSNFSSKLFMYSDRLLEWRISLHLDWSICGTNVVGIYCRSKGSRSATQEGCLFFLHCFFSTQTNQMKTLLRRKQFFFVQTIRRCNEDFTIVTYDCCPIR